MFSTRKIPQELRTIRFKDLYKIFFFRGKFNGKTSLVGKIQQTYTVFFSNGKCAENGNKFNENFEKNII